jgi:hypothetical protein
MERQNHTPATHIENNYRQPGQARILRDLSPTTREVLRMMSALESSGNESVSRVIKHTP